MRRYFALLAIAVLVSGQSDLRRMYERARVLDEQNSRIDEAIRLYGEVAQKGAGQRPLAARALFQQGVLYARTGRTADAARCWRSLITTYPDQPDLVREARSRLSPNARLNGPSARRVMDFQAFARPSPDGRNMAFGDDASGNLVLRDLATGEQRILTAKQGGWESSTAQLTAVAFARSGKLLAYEWLDKDGAVQLRAIGADGVGDRQLSDCKEFRPCTPLDWAPDGSRILVVLGQADRRNRLATISSAGGTFTSFNLKRATFGDAAAFLPDGLGIVATLVQDDGQGTDIFSISPEGREIPVVIHPARDDVVGWSSPDELVFVSDRLGPNSLWAVKLREGAPVSEPYLLRENVGFPIGFARTGALFYLTGTGSSQVYTADVDVDTARVVSAPTPVPQRFVGNNVYPNWSPDGTTVVFSSVRPSPGRSALVLFNRATMQSREITPSVNLSWRVQWMPDGKSLFSFGWESDETRGHYQIDPQTGAASLMFPIATTDSAMEGAWSPDGRFYFNRPRNWRQGLFRIDVLTREKRIIYVPPDGVNIGMENLAVSPDGRTLAFHAAGIPPGHNSLMLMSPGGGDAKPVFSIKPPDKFRLGAFTWTPDSKKILAAHGPEGRVSVSVVSADGSPVRSLGLRMPQLEVLRLSSDGKTLAFYSGERSPEIWVLEHFLSDRKRP